MLDLIALKLRRSRSTSAIFGERVTVVADQSRAVDYTALAWPAAYVCFLSETAGDYVAGSNDNWQRVTTQIGIIVGLSATNDIRGQDPALRIDGVGRAIRRAIYNWTPDPGMWGAIWYEGYKLFEVSHAATFWLFAFNSYYDICDADGETEEQFEPLPDFLGADISVDYIDPHDPGEPPSEQYDPRFGPAPWATGPEGRIELRFTIDLPPSPPARVQK